MVQTRTPNDGYHNGDSEAYTEFHKWSSCIDAFNGIMTLRYSTKEKRVRESPWYLSTTKNDCKRQTRMMVVLHGIFAKKGKERKKKMGANAYCMNRIFFFPEEMPNGSTIDIASQTHTHSLF